MEDLKIKGFIAISSGSGSGSGYGYGSGYGSGYGDGDGSGSGSGSGDGYGSGYGDGYGDGSGYGSGDGDGLKSINGKKIYNIDETATIIERVAHGVAKGFILQGDLTMIPCYIVKQDNTFAHGKTLREARAALLDKLFDDMPEEERIVNFVKEHKDGERYPDKDFFDWHHRLTGSCEMGRRAFLKNRGLENLDGSRTVKEFIALCENDYGGSIIKKLKEFYP